MENPYEYTFTKFLNKEMRFNSLTDMVELLITGGVINFAEVEYTRPSHIAIKRA